MKKKKTSKGYVPKGYVPSAAKYEKFFNEKSKMMWSIVYQRKIHLERLIHQNDHENAGICKLLKDRSLIRTITIAKPFNKEIVLKFYVNSKSNISNIYAP